MEKNRQKEFVLPIFQRERALKMVFSISFTLTDKFAQTVSVYVCVCPCARVKMPSHRQRA